MQTSDTSRLFHVGSGGTSFIGGAGVPSMGSFPGGIPPQRSYWAIEIGEGKTSASGSTIVTFPNSGFSSTPFVVMTVKPNSFAQSSSFGVVASIGGTTFTAASFNTGGTGSSESFEWVAFGLRTL